MMEMPRPSGHSVAVPHETRKIKERLTRIPPTHEKAIAGLQPSQHMAFGRVACLWMRLLREIASVIGPIFQGWNRWWCDAYSFILPTHMEPISHVGLDIRAMMRQSGQGGSMYSASLMRNSAPAV